MGHWCRVYICRVVVWWLYSNFKKGHSKVGTHFWKNDTWNLSRVRNGCAMVEKSGTIVLIIIMAFENGQLSSCCCMEFLTPNEYVGRLFANPVSLSTGYLRTRTKIYKSTANCRERASGKKLGSTLNYKYPLSGWPINAW